ncbi:MAG: 5-formyltetrahydrofolate cyclo-ligase [Gemmatimonadota bacterium]
MNDKELIRQNILAVREAEPDRETKGLAIQHRLLSLPEFADSRTILSYIGVRSEVPTGQIIRQCLQQGKRIAAPYVTKEGLRGAFITSEDELVPARFGLLEPADELRHDPDRVCEPDEVDLFVIPGVAFDSRGGRLGYGRAYYDRLLRKTKAGTRMIALAFQCQVIPEVPMTGTDVYIPIILTEKNLYRR